MVRMVLPIEGKMPEGQKGSLCYAISKLQVPIDTSYSRHLLVRTGIIRQMQRNVYGSSCVVENLG